MVKFKDFVERDIDIFINANEFAENARIDSKEVKIVRVNDEIEGKNHKKGEGLMTEELLFYISKKQMPFYPRIDQRFTLNDDDYYIVDISEDEGIFGIRAEVVSS